MNTATENPVGPKRRVITQNALVETVPGELGMFFTHDELTVLIDDDGRYFVRQSKQTRDHRERNMRPDADYSKNHLPHGFDLSIDDLAARFEEVAAFVEAIPADEFSLYHLWLPDGMAYDDSRNRMYKVADHQIGDPVGHMVNQGFHGLTPWFLEESAERRAVVLGDFLTVSYRVIDFLFDFYSAVDSSQASVARRIRFIAAEVIEGRRRHGKKGRGPHDARGDFGRRFEDAVK